MSCVPNRALALVIRAQAAINSGVNEGSNEIEPGDGPAGLNAV
jgi:hypothetical protein